VYNQAQVRALQSSASAIAVKMAAVPGLNDVFEQGIEAKIDAQRSAFGIHLYLLQAFTADEIKAFPVVGSKEKDEFGKANNNPDIVEYTDLNGTKKTVSFWKTVAVTHPIGKHHTDAIQAIVDSDKVKNAYTGRPKADNDDAKKMHQTKFTTFFGNLRQAVALFDAMRRGNEVKGVKVELAMVQARGEDGKPKFDGDNPVMEPTPSVQCIKVSDKADPAAARYFTVTNFLRLDPDKAIAAGEGYVNYITSNKRGTGDAESEDKGVKIEKITEWDDFTIAAVEFLRQIKSRASTVQALLKHYSGAGSDDALLTVFDLAEELTIITEVKALKDRAETLQVNGYVRGQGKAEVKAAA